MNRATPGAALVAHRAVVAGTLAFLVLGVPDGGEGVAWPFMRAGFAQPLDALGLLAVALTAGAVVMSALSGGVTRRIGTGPALLAASALSGAALLGVAASPVWATVVLCFFAYGAGTAVIDAAVQAHVVSRHGLRSMSAMHAGWCAGVTVGPLLMTAIVTSGAGWRAGYACMGLVYVVNAAALAWSWRAWRGRGDIAARRTAPITAPPRAHVVRSLLLFFLVTGMETSAALWMFTFLTGARGMGTAAAGVAAGAFFAVQTLSRVVLAAAGHRARAATVLATACLTALGGALLMLVLPAAASVAGVVVAGAGIGVLYPSLMVASSGNLGERRAQAVVGWQVAAANLGAASGAAATGVVLQRSGVGTFPVVLIALSAVIAALLSAPRGAGGSPAAG
jgi:fucose permease